MEFLGILKQYTFWNNSLYDYIISLGAFILLLIVLKLFQVVILSRLRKLAKKTKTNLDDALINFFNSIKPPFYLIIALWLSIKFVTLPDAIDKIVTFFFVIFIVYEVVRVGEKIAEYSLQAYSEKRGQDKQNASIVQLTKLAVRILLWSIGLLMILSNFGVNISSLIASLGIGGIAIALAVQNVLSDIFSAFSIYMDKPFEVGDYIMIGTGSGTVEKIGLKSTRIKTMRGEELVVPNKELTSVRVQNFKKLKKRRDLFIFGVKYETAQEKLEKIPDLVKEIVENVEGTEFARCHFIEFADSSLNFETVYFVNSDDYNLFMDVKQKVNFELFKKLGEEGIEFAYPTQTLFINKA